MSIVEVCEVLNALSGAEFVLVFLPAIRLDRVLAPKEPFEVKPPCFKGEGAKSKKGKKKRKKKSKANKRKK